MVDPYQPARASLAQPVPLHHLLAAIHGKAQYLLVGDGRHFQHFYGKRIEGVLVLRPAQYFERRRQR